MSNETVVTFLTSVLSSVLIKPDEDAQLYHDIPGAKTKPLANVSVLVNKKPRQFPIFLPTDEQMKGKNRDNYKFFPFAESIFMGNSEMLNFLIRSISTRIHICTYITLSNLIKTKLDKENKSYGNTVVDILKDITIKKALGTSVLKVTRAIEKVKPYGTSAIAAISLDRSPEDKTFNRQAKLRIVNVEKDKIFGVNPDQQTRDLIEDLINAMFGDLSQYVQGSSSKMCPSFFSILKTFIVVSDRLNEINNDLGIYKDDTCVIDDSWFSMLEDEAALETYHTKHIIAKLEGNVGTGSKANAPKETVETSDSGTSRPKRNFSKPSVQERAQEEEVYEEEVAEEEPVSGGLGGGSLGGGTLGGGLAQSDNDIVPQTSTSYVRSANSGLRGTVVPPKNAKRSVRVHVCDENGVKLYWEGGDPYMLDGADGDVATGMIWAVDRYGQYLHLPNGEPELISCSPRNNRGGYNNRNERQHHNNDRRMGFDNHYDNVDVSNMTYAERKAYENEMTRRNSGNDGYRNGSGFDSFSNDRGGFDRQSNDFNSNSSSFGNNNSSRSSSFGNGSRNMFSNNSSSSPSFSNNSPAAAFSI